VQKELFYFENKIEGRKEGRKKTELKAGVSIQLEW
jgi:hypothetical protein